MNIHITGRHIDITAPLKAFTESKVHKLERFIDGITDIHVTLSVEKYRQRAEVNVHSGGNTYLTAVEESEDLYGSIQQAIEKIEAQAKKKSSKRVGKQRRGSRQEGTFDVIARDGGEATDEDSGPPRGGKPSVRHQAFVGRRCGRRDRRQRCRVPRLP